MSVCPTPRAVSSLEPCYNPSSANRRPAESAPHLNGGSSVNKFHANIEEKARFEVEWQEKAG